ncbi:hypothetical protein D7006_18560 [Xanthobacter sp. YC-JY1]|nr:hypothetical protein D7006_18560 [Xanthobacter sp. YC-JY1]
MSIRTHAQARGRDHGRPAPCGKLPPAGSHQRCGLLALPRRDRTPRPPAGRCRRRATPIVRAAALQIAP